RKDRRGSLTLPGQRRSSPWARRKNLSIMEESFGSPKPATASIFRSIPTPPNACRSRSARDYCGWRTLFGRGHGWVSDDFNSEPLNPKENCRDLDDHQRLGAAAGQRSFEHLRFL